ncbi:bifunctional phosphoribosyl-AMP cyclohydrolase/phosphoribosyl-ATP diphosphatase HisIE [Paraglaciecola chathamensis]|jgi:phosphoribosyl-ATP pyrophosphohydrolase/phosphoribosyl-AMP cyclohydrolase|uniref:Histidine biosynthesis bifunctional protein HisIE n=3 Tax=Paraglaciecola chathamensis TaxID=368405 RepID=A0A8H9ID41_9ALTE|nr:MULTISPECIES: bifunctional phosphoribosyl-AMP cyclohydrolase/phosphoribosyl-ATP diphosphatase HisIE [Paraglaciecola]AEE22394.1 phosphoribosyl-ATP diphosphatase [Glaciecola sp. 4H-3-7+YE-5]MBN24030.1 bifunctional phosphoribosyl-AMP cyclohydrolase/phosphoribosyl-ATP diphosphatase HisIE [Alteromonadaceae bacterium]MBJ2138737.1 bifunctional phosphoribosyl-AMP cyclohydrolase/phosphoribosyl-ATP diphosphatase HisIE [Paraglaciecola chathamensis]MDO6561386.1 bifunctional phosphoribosyl-AMP cyclohydro|tara:strand:+ start:14519 stop:15139 length:621 start_codon:yes stop_codon:yes gene_type:complete
MIINKQNVEQLAWQKMDNLLPCIVQDATTGKVLMQGYMNTDAINHTLETRHVTFFSRSKQRLWTKGETSGHTLDLVELSADCDKDSILALAYPNGPTCHLGTETCWADAKSPSVSFIAELEQVIASRKGASPDSSYTAHLYSKGIKRIAQKVGEEGVETALAATVKDLDELKNESADLLYHLLVLLQASDLSLSDVVEVLQARHAK